MAIAVIGATGRVGSEIVRGALACGEALTALVRDPGKARRTALQGRSRALGDRPGHDGDDRRHRRRQHRDRSAVRRQLGLSPSAPQLLLIPVLYVVMELTVRLGATTGKGHAEAIREHFGPRWAALSVGTLLLSLAATAGSS